MAPGIAVEEKRTDFALSRSFPHDVAVLIPAWQPDMALCHLAGELAARQCPAIIVVNDGNGPEFNPIFEQVAAFPNTVVLRHAVNQGKGRALKTGFNFLLTALPVCTGVVTADADGQHSIDDIVRVAMSLAASGQRTVLGSRQFARHVPLRSRFGNTITRSVFAFLTGHKISDTQTGLRGFPVGVLPRLLALPGERYEFEMTVLAALCRSGTRPVEVPVSTIYIDGNRSSHFDPIRDSMRIYFVLLRFYASSLVAASIDFAGFAAAFALTRNILLSMVVGRLSSIVNFILNRGFVFQSRSSVSLSLWRYYLLVAGVAALSYAGIRGLSVDLGWNVLAAKICVETLLSLASFAMQRTFVFPVKQE